MQSHANAIWSGDLKSGKGAMTAQSGVFDQTPFTFATRFEGAKGTNPEEMIAAAHAGCFSMAFSNELAKAGLKPESVATRASVQLDMLDSGPTITKVVLTTHAKVPGATEAKVREIGDAAKAGCPVSKVLKAEVTLTLSVET